MIRVNKRFTYPITTNFSCFIHIYKKAAYTLKLKNLYCHLRIQNKLKMRVDKNFFDFCNIEILRY